MGAPARVYAPADAAYYLRHRLPFVADAGMMTGECADDDHVYTVRSGSTIIAEGPCYQPAPLAFLPLPGPPSSQLTRARRHQRIVREALR
jgi:hypothetical protein